jgi:hypothetical protein
MNLPFRSLLPYAFGLLLAGGIVAAKAPTADKQYDYVTLEKVGYRLYISEGDEKYEETKLKDAFKDVHHYGPLYKLVNAYEAKGYEVFSSNVVGYSASSGTTVANFVLLRKPK